MLPPAPMLKAITTPSNWRALLISSVRMTVIMILLAVGCRWTLMIFGEVLVLIGR